jgi:hypothetical protein
MLWLSTWQEVLIVLERRETSKVLLLSTWQVPLLRGNVQRAAAQVHNTM